MIEIWKGVKRKIKKPNSNSKPNQKTTNQVADKTKIGDIKSPDPKQPQEEIIIEDVEMAGEEIQGKKMACENQNPEEDPSMVEIHFFGKIKIPKRSRNHKRLPKSQEQKSRVRSRRKHKNRDPKRISKSERKDEKNRTKPPLKHRRKRRKKRHSPKKETPQGLGEFKLS